MKELHHQHDLSASRSDDAVALEHMAAAMIGWSEK